MSFPWQGWEYQSQPIRGKGGKEIQSGVKKSISRGGKPQPLLSDVRGRGEISISSILGWGVWNKGGVDLQTKLSERDRDPWYKRERDSGKEIPRKEKLSESGISNESRLVAGKHLILSNTCPKGTESPKISTGKEIREISFLHSE